MTAVTRYVFGIVSFLFMVLAGQMGDLAITYVEDGWGLHPLLSLPLMCFSFLGCYAYGIRAIRD